jgi:phosphate transport system protein
MTHDEHTLKRFDAEQEEIRAHILKMGGLVEIQLKLALHSLFETNTYLARQVIDQDRHVNQLEVEIDGLCCSAIARHKPTASDLRLIVNVTKIIVHLERIGDEAKKIANIAERRAQHYRLVTPRFLKINSVTELTQSMLQDVLHSFARLEPQAAIRIIVKNDLLKHELDIIFRHQIDFMTEHPHTISTSLETLFILKAIERIGDHIKFISELVVSSSNRYYDTQYQSAHEA